MTAAVQPIAFGSPRFGDPRLASLARSQGALAAWQRAFAETPSVAEVLGDVGGNFAVGIVLPDGRAVLAVDRFAIDSMCYRVDGDAISFASRADALAYGAAPLDPQAIFDYLYFHVIPSPRTIFTHVRRLPPGHFAVFDKGHLTIAPYWIPTFEEGVHRPFDTLRREFRGLLREAVDRNLDGSKPACFLSGGTDSSTIAGMIGLANRQPAATYSIGFDAAGYDEMEFARIASKHFRTEHHEYYVTPDDLLAGLSKVAAHYDQPFGNSSALPAYYCARMAREDGVTRILAGDGGDELFGGNVRYAKQAVFDWYGRLPEPVRRLLEPVGESAFGMRVPVVRKFASYVNQARVPMPDRVMTYNLLFHFGPQDVLTPPMLAQVDPDDPVRQQRALWPLARADDLVNRMLAFDWRYTLADCDLPKVVGTAELAGLSVGFPMLDDDLLAFSTRLPSDYKVRGLRLRWFFKESLRDFLPEAIIAKKKHGFGLPFGVWMTRNERLRSVASESLHNLADRGIVQRGFVQSLLSERLNEHAGYFGEMVWILMMLELWLAAKAPSYRLC